MKAVKPKKRKLLEVIWEDHTASNGGWTMPDNPSIMDPYLVRSVGWVVKETKDRIVLANMIEIDERDPETERFGQYQVILKGTVKKRRVIAR